MSIIALDDFGTSRLDTHGPRPGTLRGRVAEESAVESTRSQNITVSWRRSASGGEEAAGRGAGTDAGAAGETGVVGSPIQTRTRPASSTARLLALDELIFERFQVRVIELKLQLEGPIRQAAPLTQQSDRLIHYRDKVHRIASLPRAGPVLMHDSIIA